MGKMKINVFDTTLRDGEQTPGVSLKPNEKLRIATKLTELGVDVIEAGTAITSTGEREAIKLITQENLDAEIATLARPLKKDINSAIECNVDTVNLVVSTSKIHMDYKLNKSPETILEETINAIEYSKDHGLLVEISGEDASRADINFVNKLFTESIKIGADRVCVCDTVGILTPDKTQELFKNLNKFNPVLSVHCHNDFGLAVANTVSAIQNGATQFHATINGIGERAGNASLEETIMILENLYNFDTNIDTTQLVSTSKLVSRLTGVFLQPNKSIVGENAFAHESGIHTDGIIKDSSTYEPITPESVGHRRKFVMGKHIGYHALENSLKELGLKVEDEQFKDIFKRIKSLGDMGKCVSDVDVQAIADDVLGIDPVKVIELEELNIVSGNKVTPTASVKLKIHDESVIVAGVGVGPVDAAIAAIKSSLKDDIKLEEFHVDAITGGTDALVDVMIKVSLNGKVISARSTQPDIINASVEAFISGINRLLIEFE